MMRRIPYTLLVCLALLMSTVLLAPAWAVQSEDGCRDFLSEMNQVKSVR